MHPLPKIVWPGRLQGHGVLLKLARELQSSRMCNVASESRAGTAVRAFANPSANGRREALKE